MSRRKFNFTMLILSGPALRGYHCATMDIHEIAIREAVCFLSIFGSLIVDSKMPFGVLAKAMLLDKLVFLLCGRLVLTPCVSSVPHSVVPGHQSFSVLKCGFI